MSGSRFELHRAQRGAARFDWFSFALGFFLGIGLIVTFLAAISAFG
jgi:hypothetical protein